MLHRREHRADRIAHQRRAGVRRARQHGGNARHGRYAGGIQFGDHATRADPGRRTGDLHVADRVDHIRHKADAAGARRARRSCIQAVHIREQHQRISPDEVCHQCRKPVVVAETDLVARQRIVLVDDRHHAEFQQTVQRALHVAVLDRADRVFGSDQNLADPNAETTERGLILRHQQPLADRGDGLLRRHVTRTALEAERAETRGDGARRHQHHAGALRRGGGQRGHQGVQLLDIQMPGRLRQRARTDFDDHGPCACDGAAHIRFSDGQHALPSRSRIS